MEIYISSHHIVHFSGASSKTPAPQPLTKQVANVLGDSVADCRVTNAGWQAPDKWAGDGK